MIELRRRTVRISLVVAAIIVAIVGLVFGYQKWDRHSRMSQLFGGSAGLAAVRDATLVNAYRVESALDRNPVERDHANKFGGYPLVSGPVQLDSNSAEKLAKLLLQDDIYWWDAAVNCIFMPGIGVRFDAGNGAPTDVLFCFECNQVMFICGGKRAGVEEIGSIRDELLKVFKPLFPDDEDIQKLKTVEQLRAASMAPVRRRSRDD